MKLLFTNNSSDPWWRSEDIFFFLKTEHEAKCKKKTISKNKLDGAI